MKTVKRITSLLLSICMLLACASGVSAVSGEPNVQVEVSSTSVNVGDEVTVTLSCVEHVVSGFGFYLDFDKDLLECTEVLGPDGDDYYYLIYLNSRGRDAEAEAQVADSVADTNKDGCYSFGWVPGSDTTIVEQDLITLTFVAKAAGTVEFVLNEQTSGTDAFKGVAATETLTIKGSEPEHVCTAGAVSYEQGTNGKHTKIVACADNCGENYSVTEEDCSGGTATCENAAVCAYCGNTYGTAKGHGNNGFRYDHNTGADTHDVICNDCGKTVEEDVDCTFEDGSHVCKFACGNKTDCADSDNNHKCDVCGGTLSECADNNSDHKCDVCGAELSKCADSDNNHKCDVCGAELSKCADNDNNHKCDVCGDTLSECADNNNDHKCDVCDTKLTDCADKTGDEDHKCDTCGKDGITKCSGGTATCLKPAVCDECGKEYGEKNAENHVGKQETAYTDNGANHTVTVTCECGGEVSSDNEPHNYGEGFECICGHKLAGWQQKGDDWYYVVDGKPVTGTTRVPYPTMAINGVTYGPNAEDKAYSESHADSKYTDAETAMFIFGEDGKFQYNTTGIVGNRYAVNGMIPWHYGLVEINGEYYYFIGDVAGGGNIGAEGDTYVVRTNGVKGFKSGDVYNFAGGKLSGANGIVDMKYYENSKLMKGKGLIKVGNEYIYVRSNGQLATGKYWITTTNGICEKGMYTFDENGFLQTAVSPDTNGIVDGVYYKNGVPYYAGLIEIDGKVYYVKSNGELATGKYYITKVDQYEGDLDLKRGDMLVFGEDGVMEPIKNGIYENDGAFYYYEKNHMVKGAGVVKMTDDNGVTFYIYVKANGQLATGKYWPTTRNDLLERGEYDWGTDGRYYPA